MPLTPKQRKVVDAGQAACSECGACCARMRQLGYPNEGLEERQKANEAFWAAAQDIIQQYDEQAPQRKKPNG